MCKSKHMFKNYRNSRLTRISHNNIKGGKERGKIHLVVREGEEVEWQYYVILHVEGTHNFSQNPCCIDLLCIIHDLQKDFWIIIVVL